MRFEHCLAPPSPTRALTSALTIATAYFLGGLLPLLPYFFVGEGEVERALWVSVAVMAGALFGFGWVKTGVVGGRGWQRVRGGGEMVVVGGVAAGAAMGLVRAFGAGE
jgi:vacuolar iron transporter family protein